MYKVFLVDDEIVIRENIRNSFPWEGNGGSEFSLAGEAPDGEIALQMMQDVKPDILITDIRMPFMDGMQLCEAVSHTMPWVQIVILSGYDDFAYAQQAISLGVKEYLLKPVSAQELLEVLERIAGRIREERRAQADLLRIKRQLASSSAFLREKLLSEALGGVRGEENVQSLLERARALNLSLLARRYLVILACPRGGEEGRTLAQSALYRLADGSGDAVHACEAQGAFALIVLGDSDEDLEERAYGFAQAALYEVERATGKSAHMCIGEAVESLSELPRSCHSAQRVRRAMELSSDAEKRRIMGVRDMEALPPAAPAINLDVSPLSERLQYANREDVEGILKDYIASMGSAAIHSVMMVNFLYVEILMAASRIIKESGGEPARSSTPSSGKTTSFPPRPSRRRSSPWPARCWKRPSPSARSSPPRATTPSSTRPAPIWPANIRTAA